MPEAAEQPQDLPLPCAEKLVFDTKVQAQAAATVADFQRGVRVRPYRCSHCHLWHLASDFGND